MKRRFFVAIFVLVALVSSLVAYAASISWPSNLTRNADIRIAVTQNYEPSGVIAKGNVLYSVCNTGQVTKMDLNGANQTTVALPSYTDLEAVAVTNLPTSDPDIIYLGIENADAIIEFSWKAAALQDPNRPGIEVLGTAGAKSWNLVNVRIDGDTQARPVMNGVDNSGLEGLTFVPNGYQPANIPDSLSGGFFYAGIQRAPVLSDNPGVTYNDYLIYVFDVDLSTSGHIRKWWGIPVASGTPNGDIADMYFSKDTGVLYVLYDGSNRLIEMRTDGTVIRDYKDVPVADQEGVMVRTNYPTATADVYLASDSTKLIGWFSGYSVNYDVDGDSITNSSDVCPNSSTINSKTTYYQDLDKDDFGSDVSVQACSSTPPDGYVANSNDSDDNHFDSNDIDDDGYIISEDCDDNNPLIHDDITYYYDEDHDGLGFLNNTILACSYVPPTGFVANHDDVNDRDHDNDNVLTSQDCNDDDATIYQNSTYYYDGDSDGLGTVSLTTSVCSSVAPEHYADNSNDTNDNDHDNDNVVTSSDCNDDDPTLSVLQSFYQDVDGDSHGSTIAASFCALTAPQGYVTNSSDCDDANSAIYASRTYYKDLDADGLGDIGSPNYVCSMTAPEGFVDNSNDVNDNDHDNDGALTFEDCNDDDSVVYKTERYYQDFDHDSLGSSVSYLDVCSLTPPQNYVTNYRDCDDTDALLTSLRTYYKDADMDSFGDLSQVVKVCSLTPPSGYVSNSADTNDNDFDNDGAMTLLDCNDHDSGVSVPQVYFEDKDRDGLGFEKVVSCISLSSALASGYVTNSDDANDDDHDNDGITTQNDCDDNNSAVLGKQTYYFDADGDFLGSDSSTLVCSQPAKYVTNSDDLNDNDYDNDGVITSRDCNDRNALYFYRYLYFIDRDGDGYGSWSKIYYGCVPPTGYVRNSKDRNDNDPKVH